MAALFLPKIGINLAKETGLSQTFVGNIFIALATTLPEFVISFTAVKRGAIDLGIIILGSLKTLSYLILEEINCPIFLSVPII